MKLGWGKEGHCIFQRYQQYEEKLVNEKVGGAVYNELGWLKTSWSLEWQIGLKGELDYCQSQDKGQ